MINVKAYLTPSKMYTTTLNLKVPKDSSLEEALGVLDELIASLNLVLSLGKLKGESAEMLQEAIDNTSKILTLLAMGTLKGEPQPEKQREFTSKLERTLEESLNKLEEKLRALWKTHGELREFTYIFPSELSARLNLARTICRRAERRVIEAYREYEFSPLTWAYLNRLSDLLFLLSLNELHKGDD